VHGGTFVEVVGDLDLDPVTLNMLDIDDPRIENDEYIPSLPQ